MNYAGVDFSSHAVDVVLVDEDTGAAEWHRWPLEGQDAFDRARNVRLAMPGRGWWEDRGVVALAIEEPAGHNTRPLNRVQGAILALLPASLLVYPLRPSEWRKLVGLPGNASKAAVAEQARKTAGVSFPEGRRLRPIGGGVFVLNLTLQSHLWPQDACDAYCLALAVRALVEQGQAA